MTATPMRCHHTETLLKSATMLTPNVLMSPWISNKIAVSSTTYRFDVHDAFPETRKMNSPIENPHPNVIPAVTATWPSRLNQPVNHDQIGPLFPGANFADQ